MKKTGIYRIYNKETDRSYVGQALDIDTRWNSHIRELNERCHHNILLQQDWEKYGEKSFEFTIITQCNPVELNALEKLYMDLYNCTNVGYNVAQGNSKISKRLREEILKKEKTESKTQAQSKNKTAETAKKLSMPQDKTSSISEQKKTQKKCSETSNAKREEVLAWETCMEKLQEFIVENLQLEIRSEASFSVDAEFFEWYLKTYQICKLLPWQGEHKAMDHIRFRLFPNFFQVIGTLTGQNYDNILAMDDKTIKIYPKSERLDDGFEISGDNQYLSYGKQGNRYVFTKIKKRDVDDNYSRDRAKRLERSHVYEKRDFGRIKLTGMQCPLLPGLFEIREYMQVFMAEEEFYPLYQELEQAIGDLITKTEKLFFHGNPLCVVENRYFISKTYHEDEYYILDLSGSFQARKKYESVLEHWKELADLEFAEKDPHKAFWHYRGYEMRKR